MGAVEKGRLVRKPGFDISQDSFISGHSLCLMDGGRSSELSREAILILVEAKNLDNLLLCSLPIVVIRSGSEADASSS